mmetsp:Transcript_38650/g.99249  ORF Transcript_38650/g.99249 Transcript_38650/m.99249 type:complete len:212 (-) Transcript_38650:672-1307(-)
MHSKCCSFSRVPRRPSNETHVIFHCRIFTSVSFPFCPSQLHFKLDCPCQLHFFSPLMYTFFFLCFNFELIPHRFYLLIPPSLAIFKPREETCIFCLFFQVIDESNFVHFHIFTRCFLHDRLDVRFSCLFCLAQLLRQKELFSCTGIFLALCKILLSITPAPQTPLKFFRHAISPFLCPGLLFIINTLVVFWVSSASVGRAQLFMERAGGLG